jgi:Flp pilus assembly CpaE family ATPase
VRLVVNRWSKNIELDQKQVEDFLGERVIAFIQSDYRAAVNSINLGQPLIESAPGSTVTTDLYNLAGKVFAEKIEAPPAAPTGKRPFNSLFKRSSATMQDLGLNAALERANLGEAQ